MEPAEFMLIADPQFGFRDVMARAGAAGVAALRAAGFLAAGDPDPELPDPESNNLEIEASRLEAALIEANRRGCAFVVICGDMVNDIRHGGQLDRLRTACEKLTSEIPIRWIPGNHDLAVDFRNGPTPEGLAWYRQNFGDDYYSFRAGDVYFLAANSELLHDPSQIPDEFERQIRFIEDSLTSSEATTARRRVVFMHRPLFIGDPDEDHPQVLAPGVRKHLTRLFEGTNVETVMAGHWHRESLSRHGAMEVVVTSAIGFPISGRPGYRTVRIDGGRLSHTFNHL